MRKMLKGWLAAIVVAVVLATGNAWAMAPAPAAECTLCADDFNNAMQYANWVYQTCMTHTPGPACGAAWALQAAAAEWALFICEGVILAGG